VKHKILSSEGKSRLEELVRHRTLYAFDYDGTLCPIVSHPKDACMSDETSRLLSSLASRAPAAVLTGRSLADIRTRVRSEHITLIGNHGAESGAAGFDPAPLQKIASTWLNTLRLTCPQGVMIEDKGISLSLHFRNVANQEAAYLKLKKLVSQLEPSPRVIEGKLVLNLLPGESPDKGQALLGLMSQYRCERALFVGDDVTDEDVFRLHDERILGVRVGCSSLSKASHYLESQSDIDALFAILLQAWPHSAKAV
jgi:trehalose 6-phosphate phosphatase